MYNLHVALPTSVQVCLHLNLNLNMHFHPHLHLDLNLNLNLNLLIHMHIRSVHQDTQTEKLKIIPSRIDLEGP